jgi:putative serine protease PepD
VTAAVLVGALLVGGAAGVGGAAWYDAWQGNDSNDGAITASGDGTGATNASAPAGSVEQVAAKVLPSVVKISVTGSNQAGSGSGIILDPDGEILTNNHVVAIAKGGGAITVGFNDGKTARATVVGTDPVTDIAVIKVADASGLTPATIGHSSSLRVGQQVIAIGSPYGLSSTVTSGIVSALNRPVSVETDQSPQQGQGQLPFDPFGGQQQQPQQQPQQQLDPTTTYPAIQTDAAINPGNSGGPLVDTAGRVVGINSSIRTADSGGDGSIGLGFAIPIDEVLPIINQIRDGQTPTHARLGVTVSSVSSDSTQQGARVRSVDPNGVARSAGLKAGDVITKVDDQVIADADSLVATIRGHRPGDSVDISYVRAGSTHTVTVDLGSDENTRSS